MKQLLYDTLSWFTFVTDFLDACGILLIIAYMLVMVSRLSFQIDSSIWVFLSVYFLFSILNIFYECKVDFTDLLTYSLINRFYYIFWIIVYLDIVWTHLEPFFLFFLGVFDAEFTKLFSYSLVNKLYYIFWIIAFWEIGWAYLPFFFLVFFILGYLLNNVSKFRFQINYSVWIFITLFCFVLLFLSSFNVYTGDFTASMPVIKPDFYSPFDNDKNVQVLETSISKKFVYILTTFLNTYGGFFIIALMLFFTYKFILQLIRSNGTLKINYLNWIWIGITSFCFILSLFHLKILNNIHVDYELYELISSTTSLTILEILTFTDPWRAKITWILVWFKITILTLFWQDMPYLNTPDNFNTIVEFIDTFYFMKLSMYFVVLTTFIFWLCAINNINRKKHIESFIILFLMLEFFLLKAFSTTNLLEFYVFFEGVLIPMFILILIWGSGERRSLASYYLFLYTVICSLPMLMAVLYIGISTGTYNIIYLQYVDWPYKIELILWVCFFLGFAVKIPMFPVHLWLPEAHVEAPTDGSVILASLLLKLGGYGFIRILLPIFPLASIYFLPLVNTLAILGIIYASLTAIRQIDLKKIVAYSSIAHMNLAVLGIFSLKSQGIVGSIYFMLGHGVVAGALFFMIGMLYDRHKTRLIHYFGGLTQVMPMYATMLFIFILANLSLPGTCNFVGELLIFVGVFQTNTTIAVLAGLGIVLSAVYSLWLFNRIIFSSLNIKYINTFSDLTLKEFIILFILAVLTILFGLFPNIILSEFYFIKYYF